MVICCSIVSPPMPARGLVLTISCLLLSLVLVQAGHAQERPVPTDTSDAAAADTSAAVPDTSRTRTDTTRAARPPDTTEAPDRRRPATQRRTSQDTTRSGGASSPASENGVTFSAQDSLVIRSDSAGNDRGTLHGTSEVSYRDANLKARTIELDFQSATLTAQGAPSDTMQNSRPVFQQGSGGGGGTQSRSSGGGQSFTGDVLAYNLNTERGRVVAARTARKDAFIEGDAVKMFEDSTLFVQDGSYTTCDCPPGVPRPIRSAPTR